MCSWVKTKTQLEGVIIAGFHWSADLPVNSAVVFTPGMIMLLGQSEIADRSQYGAEEDLVKTSEADTLLPMNQLCCIKISSSWYISPCES